MPPFRATRSAALALGLAALAAAGCATAGNDLAGPPLRAAVDAPARFEPVPPSLRLQPGDTVAGGGCRSPMADPRDGTELRMVRSTVVRADYAVTEGRYGVGEGELLRLECNTGRPVGVVRR